MKLGNLDISTVKLGASQVQAIYQGPNLVWQNAPVATAATGVGQTSFTANWNAYTGAVVYLLDVSASPTFDTFIYENQQVNAPTTSYVVIGLNPNTTYYYRVRASTEALTDPDAQAFFDRVTTAGGTLSATEQDAVNTLVVQMKADGIWTKMKAIYPMVGASAAACAQNLKSSSFTGTFTAGWTFASTGVTPNGTSAFMDTNLVGNQLTNNNHHQSFYSRTSVNSLGMQIGASNASFGVLIAFRINNGGNFQAFSNMSDFTPFLNVSNSTSQGLCTWSRISSTDATGYMDTTNLGTLTDTTTGDTANLNSSFYIGALNQGGTADQFSPNECAFCSIGDGLSNTQASDLYTAVQAFQTTLSRNV